MALGLFRGLQRSGHHLMLNVSVHVIVAVGNTDGHGKMFNCFAGLSLSPKHLRFCDDQS